MDCIQSSSSNYYDSSIVFFNFTSCLLSNYILFIYILGTTIINLFWIICCVHMLNHIAYNMWCLVDLCCCKFCGDLWLFTVVELLGIAVKKPVDFSWWAISKQDNPWNCGSWKTNHSFVEGTRECATVPQLQLTQFAIWFDACSQVSTIWIPRLFQIIVSKPQTTHWMSVVAD